MPGEFSLEEPESVLTKVTSKERRNSSFFDSGTHAYIAAQPLTARYSISANCCWISKARQLFREVR